MTKQVGCASAKIMFYSLVTKKVFLLITVIIMFWLITLLK